MVMGLVWTKPPELEHEDDLVRRMEDGRYPPAAWIGSPSARSAGSRASSPATTRRGRPVAQARARGPRRRADLGLDGAGREATGDLHLLSHRLTESVGERLHIRTASRIAFRAGWGGIAPEGTVGTGECLLPIQKGPARIALLAGCPVIPIGIWGAQRRYPKEGIHLERRSGPRLGVAFGTPIFPEGDPRCRPDVQALTDRLGEAMREQVEVARRLAPGPV